MLLTTETVLFISRLEIFLSLCFVLAELQYSFCSNKHVGILIREVDLQ